MLEFCEENANFCPIRPLMCKQVLLMTEFFRTLASCRWGFSRIGCWGGCVGTGEWRRLHNKELYTLYSSPNIFRVIKSRRLRWAQHVVCMGERKGTYRILVRKPEGRRPLQRPRSRWEDNIKMIFESWMGGGAWTGLIWLRIGTGCGLLWIRWWISLRSS